MIEINTSFFIQMANFLLLLYLMNLVLYRPIRRFVAERNAYMLKQQSVIDQADADASAAVREFDEKIQNARLMGRQKAQEMKESAHNREKELLQGASEEAAKQVQEVRAKLRKEIEMAREQLKNQVQAFSLELAQKILGRGI